MAKLVSKTYGDALFELALENGTEDEDVAAKPEAPKGDNGFGGFVIFLVVLGLAVVCVYVFRKQLAEVIEKHEAAKFEARKAELEKAFADEGKENETEN